MKQHAFLAMLAAASGAISVARADTEPEIFTYTNGNLILGFQATGGTGSQKNVFFDLGKATDFRNNGAQGVLGNIGATLTATYGTDWYDRADLWFGVIGNLNTGSPTGGASFTSPVDGDPSRTFYLSTAAASPGSGLLYAPSTFPSSTLGNAGTTFQGLKKVLFPSEDGTGWNFLSSDPLARGLQKEADGAGILDEALSQHATAWNNSWTVRNPFVAGGQGAAFSYFTGGIQQNFGKGGSATYVDVQRVLASNTGANPTGVVGGGTYETTISISSAGAITSLIASPPSSTFTTWIGSFNPPLTNPADREADADPDQDGIDNLMEFVLNGNPAVSGQSILPTLDSSGLNFVFSFIRRADSAGEAAQVFEYSTDLVDWTTNTPVTIPNTPGTSGVVSVGASTGTAPNQVQAVTITIPKAANTKLFGRLKAVK